MDILQNKCDFTCSPPYSISKTVYQTARIYDIADVPFDQVDPGEKQAFAGKIKETGSYQGYKLRSYWVRIHLHDGHHQMSDAFCYYRST